MKKTLITFMTICAVLPSTSLADGEQRTQMSLEELTDQGRLYVRKGRYKPAYRVLTKAYKRPGGPEDFRTVYNRGIAAQQILLLEVAFEMSEKAEQLAGASEKRTDAVKALKNELNRLYGRLDVKLAPGETNQVGRIFLESKTGILNPKKRTVFQSIRERFRATDVTLPTTIYLPHGGYTANNVPLVIEQNKVATVEVYLQIQRKPVAAVGGGVNRWWLAGVGAAAVIATSVGAYFLLADDSPETIDRINVGRIAPSQ
ncbi:MAG: hypothetical protein VX589_13210 [Myxococcota bacterium]|nr:hypothetical protein [Myxococcota bacterium]